MPEDNTTDLVAKTRQWWEQINGSLGITYIDTQHLWLASLILRLEEISQLQSLAELSHQFREVLTEVIVYADQHFKAEEAALVSLKYPAEAEHRKQHAAFVATLHKLSRSQINQETARKLYRYLRQWLTTHVLKEDRHYADFFSRRKIDLNEFYRNYTLQNTTALGEAEKNFYREILGERHHLIEENKMVLEKTTQLWESFRLRIGIPVIDIQHLWLVKMAVELEYALLRTGPDKRELFALYLQEALRYAKEHFAAEEKLMAAINYPEAEKHRASHAAFSKLMQERQLDFATQNDRFAANLVRDLKEWLFSHIAIADKLLAIHARKYPQESLAISRELVESREVTFSPAQLALYRSIIK